MTTAWRGSDAGVAQRVRQDVASCEWTVRARVGSGSRHWSVRSVRAPAITSSPPLPATVTRPPGIRVSDTGGGPHAVAQSCTVKVSVTALIIQAPS